MRRLDALLGSQQGILVLQSPLVHAIEVTLLELDPESFLGGFGRQRVLIGTDQAREDRRRAVAQRYLSENLPDPVFLDLAIERPLADAERLGGFLAVAAGELQGLGDVVPLDLLEAPADEGGDAGRRRLGG